MITKKKSLAQIEFDIRHDAWIKADYQGPVITPDGEENEYAVSRRSKITSVTDWFDRLTKNPRYYRKPTEEEIQVLAKIEYEKLSKEERNKQNDINQCREAAKKYVAECNTKGRAPNIAEAVRICRAHDYGMIYSERQIRDWITKKAIFPKASSKRGRPKNSN